MDDRRSSPGRRESDRLLEVIWRELDKLEAKLREQLDRLEHDLEEIERKFQLRVTQLETHHAEERAVTGERLRDRALSLEHWQKISIGVGALGTAFGIAAILISVLH